MCLAIPGKVISINHNKAEIEYPGQVRPAMVLDVPVVKGDYVMVQMGIVVKVLTKEEAESSLKAWTKNN